MHHVLIVSITCLALATPAMAQVPYDFTVKPELATPKLKIRPRVFVEQPERFEPPGSREGNRGIDFSASRFYDEGRTEVTVKLFGEFTNSAKDSPYRDVLSPKKERIITAGVRRTF